MVILSGILENSYLYSCQSRGNEAGSRREQYFSFGPFKFLNTQLAPTERLLLSSFALPPVRLRGVASELSASLLIGGHSGLMIYQIMSMPYRNFLISFKGGNNWTNMVKNMR